MGEEQEQKFHQLTEEPVSRMISHLAVPCIISMLVTAFYNMADTFFVGMLRSNAATGAVGVVFSMMAVIQAVGFFFGHGSGNFISRELGRRNTDSASNMAATGFFSALFTGLLICVFGEIFLTPLAAFLGSSPTILPYAKDVLACDIHTRARSKRLLLQNGARTALGLDDIMTKPVGGSGFNPTYGLLGSNKATEETVKLFPRDCEAFVKAVQDELLAKTGKHIEVMVYGDGAFKDPVGKIWELADPVVSPAYTSGLEGTPNELKLKYLADNEFANLSGQALREAIEKAIETKDKNLKGTMATQGTTPRRLTDLIGSLCDLTSGSGDKGTPVVWIQGYFTNYAEG